MTLTLKTAKHAINEYGKIFNIIDDADPLSAYSVTREQAIEANKLEYELTPCIVVTTAREALEAALELAHPIPETVTTIPPETPLIAHDHEGITFASEGYDFSLEIDKDSETKLRTLTPLPEPKPELWETSRFCYADGLFLEREENEHGTLWYTVEETSEMFGRAELAKLNPRPVTIK